MLNIKLFEDLVAAYVDAFNPSQRCDACGKESTILHNLTVREEGAWVEGLYCLACYQAIVYQSHEDRHAIYA